MTRRALLWLALAVPTLAACRETIDYNSGHIEFSPDRPEQDDPEAAAPYAGDDPIVLEAQTRFPTGLDLHQKVIWRTCTPNGGVCHNSKEYPDLRTPASFAAAFGAACNVQPGEQSSVFDGCESPGDRLRLGDAVGGDREVEIAWIEQIVGENPRDDVDETSPGLHIHLASPLRPGEEWRNRGYGAGEFIRTFVDGGDVRDLVYTSYTTEWTLLGDGSHVFGRVQDYQREQVEQLLGVGIVQGDANRNGVFGATLDLGVSMLVPGSPEESYLIGRIRGEMFDEPLPGSRMPLANPPFSVAEMLALFCLVEGFSADEDPGLSGPIDYVGCSYSADPGSLNLLGEGVTWAARVQPILEANCGGCHSETAAEGELVLVGGGVYERLLMPSLQVTDLPLISPGEPERSYLYLKLTAADGIVGNPMPYNPLTGEGRLTEAELGDILTWISNGAVEDQ